MLLSDRALSTPPKNNIFLFISTPATATGMWQVFNTKYRDEQMIEVHVTKQTRVLGAQGVLHSFLFGAVTGTSHTYAENRKNRNEIQSYQSGKVSGTPPPKAQLWLNLLCEGRGCSLLYGCSLLLLYAHFTPNLLGGSYH